MKKIFLFLTKLFNNARYWVNRVVVPSITVVEHLKLLVENPITDIANDLIPGHWDDALVKLLRKYLPLVLQVLGISVDCVNKEDPEAVMICAIEALKKLHPDGQAMKFHEIAVLLIRYSSDGKLTWSESIHLAEMTYQQLKKK